MVERTCRECGCTDLDCRACIVRTGAPCSWVERDLCSACVTEPIRELIERSSIGAGLTNIRENGIDAELLELEHDLRPRRKRGRR